MSDAADLTARVVQMARIMGTATKRRRVPRAHPPLMIEANYAAAIVDLVGEWRTALQPLIDGLPDLLASARRYRQDHAPHERVERIGLDIVIENPAGSTRTWIDADGKAGETVMKWPYGEIPGALGADGDNVDAYVGPVSSPEWVFVVHQNKKSRNFAEYDEDKVMLGWATADDAKAAYLEQYDDPRFFGGMTILSAADFVAQLAASTGGAIVFRTDDTNESRRLRTLVDRGRSAASGQTTKIRTTADRVARQVADHQKREFARQMQAGLGVVVPTRDPSVTGRIAHFVTQNVSRVQGLGARTFDQIEQLAHEAFTTGTTAAEVTMQLVQRLQVAENHARSIARDVQKLFAQITRMRHEEIGVVTFLWKTRGDDLVRPSHAVKHKKIFPYRGSRAPSFFPGEEPGCRCEEEPLFDEILKRVDLPVGRQRVA